VVALTSSTVGRFELTSQRYARCFTLSTPRLLPEIVGEAEHPSHPNGLAGEPFGGGEPCE
jgi:hypothetical protein